jgi:predicted transcriptional regulator of viral defense system
MSDIRFNREIRIFRNHGGLLKTSLAIKAGIHPRTLYAMRDAGVLERLDRGVYRLADLPPLQQPDLVAVAVKAPSAVVCLISALVFHEITTQVTHEVQIALKAGSTTPRIQYPPIRVFRFDTAAFSAGVETQSIGGFEVRVYSPEKTLADCFKFRNQIGLDVALEALRFYRERRTIKMVELERFAKICRVERVMRPYLEAML